MGEKLSAEAERAAELIWAYRLGEYPVDKLAKELSIPRYEAVWLLKALQGAGHGRFVVGRRDHVSRFIRSPQRPTSDGSTAPAVDTSGPATISGSDEQTLVLLRPNPVKIVVPADLTRAEADRIARWLDIIVHE